MQGRENERFEERGKGGCGGKGGFLVKLKRYNLKLSIEESAQEAGLAEFTVTFKRLERSSPARFCKIFLQRFFGGWAFCLSAGFENQGASVVQLDFWCLPRMALVQAVRIGI